MKNKLTTIGKGNQALAVANKLKAELPKLWEVGSNAEANIGIPISIDRKLHKQYAEYENVLKNNSKLSDKEVADKLSTFRAALVLRKESHDNRVSKAIVVLQEDVVALIETIENPETLERIGAIMQSGKYEHSKAVAVLSNPLAQYFDPKFRFPTVREAVQDDSVTLAAIRKYAGEDMAISAIVSIFTQLASNFAVKHNFSEDERHTDGMMTELAHTILADYYFLKMSEIKYVLVGIRRSENYHRLDGNVVEAAFEKYRKNRLKIVQDIQEDNRMQDKEASRSQSSLVLVSKSDSIEGEIERKNRAEQVARSSKEAGIGKLRSNGYGSDKDAEVYRKNKPVFEEVKTTKRSSVPKQ